MGRAFENKDTVSPLNPRASATNQETAMVQHEIVEQVEIGEVLAPD